MKRILVGMFLILSLTIVSGQSVFCQPGTEKSSAAKDVMIKSEVETAISMLQTIYSKYQKGQFTLEQAKKLGADLMRGLQYGPGTYFWVDTTEGVCVVQPGQKAEEGKNMLELQDAKGEFIVKDLIAKAKAGGGYLNYWFPKKNQTVPLPKRSYVALFKPFGWVVATGYYL